ncbi:MAG: RagB/SusD family nutrient uptake outer membrane protein [Salinivirgaceae bacterium]
MKKSPIILTLICIVGFLTITGCEDFLDADNKSAVTADEQFSTQEGFETLLNQAYYKLDTVYEDPAIFCAGTDLYVGIRAAGDPTLEGYTLTSNNETVEGLYKNLYAVVDAANAVLYYAGNCEDFTEKGLRTEEARFIRAYAYYLLSQQFGRIPIIKNYINTAETSYPRNTLVETYQFMIDELAELSNSILLPATDNTGRASKQSVKALLAKVYLAAGWDMETTLTDAESGTYSINGTSYFTLAAATAKEVADAVSLTLPFEDKWSPYNEQNEEVIFAIQLDRNAFLDKVKGGNSHQNNFGTYLGAVTLGMKFVDSDLNPTSKTYYLYEKGDQRYNATFMTTVYNYTGDANNSNWGKQGYWAYYNATADAQAGLGIAFYFPAWYVTNQEISDYQTANANRFIRGEAKNVSQIIRTSDPVRWILYNADGTVTTDNEQNYLTALTKVGTIPPIKKFDDPATDVNAATTNGGYRDFVLLHISDIYLVAAEAYLMAGNEGEALNYLNDVRTRAGAAELASFASYQRYNPDQGGYVSADQNIDVILDERARELLGEYYRWMDLRRTRQLVKYNKTWNVNFDINNMRGGDGNLKWLRPIPADEIGLNTGISPSDQNPGYTSETAE